MQETEKERLERYEKKNHKTAAQNPGKGGGHISHPARSNEVAGETHWTWQLEDDQSTA